MLQNGVPITLIAAVARNGVIGRDGGIPWRIPSDFRHFKAYTMGKPMVMGRKQFDTVGKPLPGRANLIVTRQKDYHPEGTEVFASLEAALERAAELATNDGMREIMVIGGGEIYAQALPMADRLVISHVDLDVEGTVVFPHVDPKDWRRGEALPVHPDPSDDASYSIQIYHRNV